MNNEKNNKQNYDEVLQIKNRRDEIVSPVFSTSERSSWILYLATGFGKSKIAIDWINKYYNEDEEYIWLVPTIELRDKDVPLELEKWKCIKQPSIFCYASHTKIEEKLLEIKNLNKKPVIILDEAHRITEKVYNIIKNSFSDIILLTATKPRDKEKVKLLESLTKNVIEYDLNKSAEDNIISEFEIHLIPFDLNDKDKYIKNSKKIMVTEKEYYKKISAAINNFKRIGYKIKGNKESNNNIIDMLTMKRTRFLYDLPKKIDLANNIIKANFNKRIIVFSKSIKQIEKLTPNVYHSKTTDFNLNRFQNKEINLLGCVDALNEGKNITDVDTAIIIGLDSNYKNTIQRLGRISRFSKNKIAKLYIIYCKNTQEELWMYEAISTIDKKRVFHH